ncbi:hypothetical protein GH714_004404 [Hevea brasiliensis]|uniref:Uncharacterized protein n=1 Tax=Hevea brasiliensis TaxID=3981 RepID=A0A6A6KJ62_HEVBR|nr:hypothetical protein GH714_004404 [Hevea brasiliensis]
MAGQSRKWMILVATTWIQAFTGTNFDFSSYSSNLKSVLGISQVQLNYLAVASDMGKAFGWCSGWSLLHFPLWVVLFMAAFLGLFGYGVQWLVISKIITLPYVLTIHASFHSDGSRFNLVDTDDLELVKGLIGSENCSGSNGNSYRVMEKGVCLTCFGRVMEKDRLTMLGEEHSAPALVRSKVYFARTGWLAVVIVPTPIAFFLLVASGSEEALQACTALVGLSSGFVFSAAVSITSELFGPNSAGVNHNILITNIPIGSLLYGLLAAIVYDSNAGSTSLLETLGEEMVCMGRQCYLKTFIVWGCISLVGLVSSFLLFLRTRPAYDHFKSSRNRTQSS